MEDLSLKKCLRQKIYPFILYLLIVIKNQHYNNK